MKKAGKSKIPVKSGDPQLIALARNDWGEILTLLQKKSYRRKFLIIESFIDLVSEHGFHRVTRSQIAKKSGTSRQLVDHHFPQDSLLIALAYRYIYAKFQKSGSDGILSRHGFSAQFKGYVDAVANWVSERRNDARFLVHFYALAQSDSHCAALHERNNRIGQERIASLYLSAEKINELPLLPKNVVLQRASSIQKQMMGFVIIHTFQNTPPSEEDKNELLQSCIAILSRTL